MQESLSQTISETPASTSVSSSSSMPSSMSGSDESKKSLIPDKKWELDLSLLDPLQGSNLLGSGENATVFRGKYNHQDVAVKLYNVSNELEKLEAAVKREADVMAGLQSDFLVDMIGYTLRGPSLRRPGIFSQDDPEILGMSHFYNPPLLVMELLPQTLDQQASEIPPLLWSERYRLLRDIALAVAILHGKGLVHCDLKIENIFIDKDGRAKLGDFGSTDEVSKRLGLFCAHGYAAPELTTTLRSTCATDIFSLGVVYLRLLFPELKFEAFLIRAVLPLREGQRNIEWPKGVPPELIGVIYACCALKPEERPKAGEVAQVFEYLWRNAIKPQGPREEKESLSKRLSSWWTEFGTSPFKVLLQKSPCPYWHDPSSPGNTLGIKLQRLRQAVLTDSDKKSSHSIPPDGKTQFGKNKLLYPLIEKELLKGKAQVFLLQGPEGSGKSLFAELWRNPAWNTYRPGDLAPAAPIPIFIPLQSKQVRPKDLWDYYSHILIPECNNFTGEEIAILKRDYQFVWIADHYDVFYEPTCSSNDIPNQTVGDNKSTRLPSTPPNLYDLNQLEKYQGRVKLLITCSDLKERRQFAEENFIPHIRGKLENSIFQTYSIAPPAPQQTSQPPPPILIKDQRPPSPVNPGSVATGFFSSSSAMHNDSADLKGSELSFRSKNQDQRNSVISPEPGSSTSNEDLKTKTEENNPVKTQKKLGLAAADRVVYQG